MNMIKDIDAVKELVASSQMSLIYFTAESCNVCKVIYPSLLKLLEKYQEIKAARVDINEQSLAAGEYSVFTIPCIILFVEGKEITRQARYIQLDEIEELIVRYNRMLHET